MPKQMSPKKIRLEASSICQLKCRSCPNPGGAIQPVIGSGFLKADDFRGLADQNPWVKEIELSNYGEIFLNPDLLEIMEYAHDKKIKLHADEGVNLNRMNEDLVTGLVRFQFQSMTVSLDGAGSETYSRYRVGGDFDAVVANIRRINELKRRYHSKAPSLTWQFVVFGFNEHEIPVARKRAKALNMDFRLKLSWDANLSPVQDPDRVRKEVGFASRKEYEQKSGTVYLGGICHQLWEQPQINWDGKILGCCRNFWGEFGMNAFKDGLVESLNSEKMAYTREMLTGKKAPREDIPCTTCDIFIRRAALGDHLKRGFAHSARRFIRRTPRFRKRLRKIRELF